MTSLLVRKTDMADKGGKFRVMVVDDSAVIRGFICRYLSEDPEIDVVTTAGNGQIAVKQLDTHDVEVVVLDIEMPVMDGMTALPKLIAKKPDIMVVMASTLTLKNADISLKALQMGAMDYVPKPESARSVNASIDFRRDLVEKVKAWAARYRKKTGAPLPEKPKTNDGRSVSASAGVAARRPATFSAGQASGFVSAARPAATTARSSVAARSTGAATGAVSTDSYLSPSQMAAKKIVTRAPSMRRPNVLAVGSSTGGPQALMRFFKGFKKRPNVPILVTQHMPAAFTAILATHIKQATGWDAKEAAEGDLLQPGWVYVAPGDYHMVIGKNERGQAIVTLNQDPPENFCRPAVDPMFRSLIRVYGERVLAVVLTGMGHDGLKGGRDLVRQGATLLAQDEESSVVWGMPGAVATAGLCAYVCPIDELGKQAETQLQGAL